MAEGQIGLRNVNAPDRDDVMAHVVAIIERSFVPETRTEMTVRGEFLPLTQTPTAKRLFELYVQAAADTRLSNRRRVHRRLLGPRIYRRTRRGDDPRGRAGRR